MALLGTGAIRHVDLVCRVVALASTEVRLSGPFLVVGRTDLRQEVQTWAWRSSSLDSLGHYVVPTQGAD